MKRQSGGDPKPNDRTIQNGVYIKRYYHYKVDTTYAYTTTFQSNTSGWFHFAENFTRTRALKFTFTIYDSKGVFPDGKTFTHIVYLNN